jgi:hypothetical protein
MSARPHPYAVLGGGGSSLGALRSLVGRSVLHPGSRSAGARYGLRVNAAATMHAVASPAVQRIS